MPTQNMAKIFLKKIENQKYKNKNKMCRGWGGGQSSLFALSDL